MTAVLGAVLDVLQVAHDTQVPHEEPAKGGSGGASAIVVVAGVLVSIVAVAGLVWVKKRVDG